MLQQGAQAHAQAARLIWAAAGELECVWVEDGHNEIISQSEGCAQKMRNLLRYWPCA
jgi:hypothetical protein